MTEIERLKAWMDTKDITMKSLARKMGISYLSVYTIIAKRQSLTNNFKWRFTQVFGWETARELFDQTQAEENQPVLQPA